MPKKLLSIALAIALIVGVYVYNSEGARSGRLVKQLVSRNIEARGGLDAWLKVSSLRLTGQMDVGNGMQVPYVLEQKRPGKMRLEYVFDGETAVQSTNGVTGWKLLPFRGRPDAEPMSEQELRESADSADQYGLLFEYSKRGIDLQLQGNVELDGRESYKLQATLPRGAKRWIYLDADTGLELKLESERMIGGKQRVVETVYTDWQPVEGVLISRRQEIRTEGDNESHFVTVESVMVNLWMKDSRFEMPPAVLAPVALR